MELRYLKLLIRNNSHNFSKSDQRISEYFLQLGDQIINKTIANLSDEIGISQTTIFNFVKKLGFEGFQEFKIMLASNLHSDTEGVSSNSLTVYKEITKDDSPTEISEKIINFNIVSLNTLNETIDKESLTEVINLLANVKSLHFFGLGGSAVVAYDSFHKFLRTKYLCNYIIDYHLQLIASTKLTKDDGIFIFSHSGESIETINLVKQIKKTGATIITLTGNPASQLISYSDQSIIVYSDESKYRAESLTSRILYLTVMDIIYTSIMYSDDISNNASFDRVREAISITRNDRK